MDSSVCRKLAFQGECDAYAGFAWRASVPLQDESSADGIMSMALWQLAFEKFVLGAAMVQSGGEVLSVCTARTRFCCSE